MSLPYGTNVLTACGGLIIHPGALIIFNEALRMARKGQRKMKDPVLEVGLILEMNSRYLENKILRTEISYVLQKSNTKYFLFGGHKAFSL
jgi:hypothetical protein